MKQNDTHFLFSPVPCLQSVIVLMCRTVHRNHLLINIIQIYIYMCLCYLEPLQVNELVQVETYLRSEGVLVRYWYPIEMLERPPAGSRRTAANGLVSLDSSNIQIHR